MNVNRVNLWMAMLLSAMAGAMGWGIRGQYGHQTGAMIAGLLVGLVLVMLFARNMCALSGARAVAFTTLGIAVGGSMTYGQTVGLTHDGPLIGNWDALRWGMLGLFLKGAIWIGLAGLLLGMSLSKTRYQPAELALMFVSAIFLRFWGIQLLNEPFLPADKILPALYFSDDWFWEPDGDLKPRRELWGGLLVALAALTAYVRWVRFDRLAFRLALIGFLSGGLGFSLGQCVQAMYAWNPAWFASGWLAQVTGHFNWWNMMETTFGAIFAAGLALGGWFHQDWIRDERPSEGTAETAKSIELTGVQELLLAIVHLSAVTAWSFGGNESLGMFAGIGYTMIVVPLVAVSMGRYWPFIVVFPLVLIPIAGKTLRHITYETERFSVASGWFWFILLPIGLFFVMVPMFARHAHNTNARGFACLTLPLVAWMYFGLNYAFFEFPWPWREWTGRTPNGLIFSVCVLSLTVAAWYYGRRVSAEHTREGAP